MLGGPPTRSGFPPPSGRVTPPRCGLFLLRRSHSILGCDVAGRIEAVGKGVSTLKAGDSVYGDLSESGFGGFAEYVCTRQGSVTLKPRNLSYEQAAVLPHAAMLAQQSLRGLVNIAAGQTLLINGAGGGVGTLGVRLATPQGLR